MLMMLCVLLAVSGGMASSLFTLPSTSDVEAAVSYGVTFGKTPASESTLADGSIKQVYTQVKDDDFLSFGTVLAERGYSAVSQLMVDGVAETVVAKGDIRFTVAYDQAKHSLSVVYPADTNVEVQQIHNPFEELERSGELIRVEAGEMFKLDNVCTMTVTGFYLNEYTESFYTRYNGVRKTAGYMPTNTRIEMEAKNISTKSLSTTSSIDAVLHYIDENGHYTFKNDVWGVPTKHGIEHNHDDYNLEPLENGKWCFGFSTVPESVRTSSDGYLAVTIEACFSSMNNTQKYIIYFREP